MATETIQTIRSLRSGTATRLPAAVSKSVEAVKRMIAGLSGEKKVDWRSGKSSSGYSQGQSHGRYGHSGHSSHSRGGNDRQDRQDRQESVYRPKTAATAATAAPIPLTYATATMKPVTDVTTVTPAASATKAPVLDEQGFEVVRSRQTRVRAPPAKYVSKFKRTSEKVEDTILNTILLGKLNKFSAANYDDIKEFITQIIASGQSDMMTCFMKLVFEKAAAEEIFCPLYAKLLSELSAQYPVILPEMAKLYEAYMSIFVDVGPAESETHQEFCQRNVEKKYRRGYSQFLAELTKHNVIETAVFVDTVRKIVEQIELSQADAEAVKRVEELADCLVRMMKALGANEDKPTAVTDMALIRSMLREEVAGRVQPFTVRRADAPGVSNKARFTFMDIYEGILALH